MPGRGDAQAAGMPGCGDAQAMGMPGCGHARLQLGLALWSARRKSPWQSQLSGCCRSCGWSGGCWWAGVLCPSLAAGNLWETVLRQGPCLNKLQFNAPQLRFFERSIMLGPSCLFLSPKSELKNTSRKGSEICASAQGDVYLAKLWYCDGHCVVSSFVDFLLITTTLAIM